MEGYEGGEEGGIYDDLEESLDWDVIEEGENRLLRAKRDDARAATHNV